MFVENIEESELLSFFLSLSLVFLTLANNNQSLLRLLLLLLEQQKHANDSSQKTLASSPTPSARIMRNCSVNAPHHRSLIRNLAIGFRRQSSVNDYKLPNTLVCRRQSPFRHRFVGRSHFRHDLANQLEDE